jgi:hypothetical protein
MTDTGTGSHDRLPRVAVVLGACSIAFWFCCPFWMLTWLIALPAGLSGAGLGFVAYRTASREGASRGRSVTAMALGAVGSAAAVAYLAFLIRHPDLDIN